MTTWNGSSLVTEFSATLGDTSTSFKARVLGWMNDIQDDICSRYVWPFLHKAGKKALVTGTEFQNLNASAPGAPTLAAQNGGTLTSGSSYSVKVTFVQSSNGYETEGGTASSSQSVSGTSLLIAVSGIPVSDESLVTSRRIYLSKDSGAYYYYSDISDNTSTTTSVSADTTSTKEPPDYVGIKCLLGNPFIESNGAFLNYRDEDEMRQMFPSAFQSGVPEFFCSIDYNKIITYPMPSSALVMRLNYVKIPARIFNDSTVQPELAIWMKNILEAGVLMKGYQYRERSMAMSYKQVYEGLLAQAISERSKSRHGASRIRDVTGNSDGFVL